MKSISYQEFLLRRLNRKVVRFIPTHLVTIFCVVALVAILSRPALTAERSGGQTRTRQTQGAANPLVEHGRFPPDFELPKLTFSTDTDGNPDPIFPSQRVLSIRFGRYHLQTELLSPTLRGNCPARPYGVSLSKRECSIVDCSQIAPDGRLPTIRRSAIHRGSLDEPFESQPRYGSVSLRSGPHLCCPLH